MEQIIFVLAIVSLIMFSCTKQNAVYFNSAPLEGSWRMIIVTDNSSGLTTTKPSTIKGDVDIIFTAISDTSGTFYGNTPAN